MDHHFNVELAKRYGVNEAIMCGNLHFWIIKNRANKKHFHDGRYWTYNSAKAFAELFPYWSEKQVRTVLKNCEKKGLIVEGNYNKSAYDRTKWYAVTEKVFEVLEPALQPSLPNGNMEDDQSETSILPNGQMENTKRENGNDQSVKPIPYNNTYNKTDNNFVNKEPVNKDQEIIDKLVLEYMKKGLSKDVCLRVVNEIMQNREYIVNLGGYLRNSLEGTLFRSEVKHGKVETVEKVKDKCEKAGLPFYNFLETDDEVPY